jgi:hypothetical protein
MSVPADRSDADGEGPEAATVTPAIGGEPEVEESLLDRVADNLEAVRRRIDAAGGDRHRIRVVAVTKTFGVEAVRAAVALGIRDIGENYADELLDKAAALAMLPDAAPRWRYLGSVQRRSVPRLAPVVACFDGVDRREEGETIARHRPGAAVLVEVDTTGAAGRGGVAPQEVAGLVAALRGLGLEVEGLMTIAPPGGGAAAAACFATVAHLVADLGLAEASMGMTEDLELAVAAGSTMIRVGRALFGPRAAHPAVSQ